MITYIYWFVVALVALTFLVFLGRSKYWKAAVITAITILFISWLAYFFHFQQMFVKNYGGVMSIKVPDGQIHIAATWKDENLWIENYDPESNTCYFNEYSKGNMLEGKVVIKNCNPLLPGARSAIIENTLIHR